MPSLPKFPHVALLIETSLSPGRSMLKGIADYILHHNPWSIYLEPHGVHAAASKGVSVGAWSTYLEPNRVNFEGPIWLRDWEGDGIIARIANPQIAEAVAAKGLPVVDILGVVDDSPFPIVHVDGTAIAKMAANHLKEHDFRYFGYCGLPDLTWSVARREAFFAEVERIDPDCRSRYFALPLADSYAEWESSQDRLANWLQSQPMPIGIMVSNDPVGLRVLEAAKRAKVLVPEQLSLVSVDNDEPICMLSDPPMTSVEPNHEAVGYQAAALLEKLMDGKEIDKKSILLPPQLVISRQSTDTPAIDDPDVRSALRIIREKSCFGLSVADIVEQTNVSRSVLKKKFSRVLGSTMHDHIVATRIKRAKELLATTKMPITKVALQVGYDHPEYFGVVFKSREGMTPGAYRARNQR